MTPSYRQLLISGIEANASGGGNSNNDADCCSYSYMFDEVVWVPNIDGNQAEAADEFVFVYDKAGSAPVPAPAFSDAVVEAACGGTCISPYCFVTHIFGRFLPFLAFVGF